VDREVVPDVQVLGAVGLRGRTDRLHGDLVGEDAFTGPLHTDVVVDALTELRLVGVFLGAVVVGRDGLQGGQAVRLDPLLLDPVEVVRLRIGHPLPVPLVRVFVPVRVAVELQGNVVQGDVEGPHAQL